MDFFIFLKLATRKDLKLDLGRGWSTYLPNNALLLSVPYTVILYKRLASNFEIDMWKLGQILRGLQLIYPHPVCIAGLSLSIGVLYFHDSSIQYLLSVISLFSKQLRYLPYSSKVIISPHSNRFEVSCHALSYYDFAQQGPHFLTWFHLNPGMDK